MIWFLLSHIWKNCIENTYGTISNNVFYHESESMNGHLYVFLSVWDNIYISSLDEHICVFKYNLLIKCYSNAYFKGIPFDIHFLNQVVSNIFSDELWGITKGATAE